MFVVVIFYISIEMKKRILVIDQKTWNLFFNGDFSSDMAQYNS